MKMNDYISENRLDEAAGKTKEEKKTRRDVYLLLDKYMLAVEKLRKTVLEDKEGIDEKIRKDDKLDWGAVEGMDRLYSNLGNQLVMIRKAKTKVLR